MESPSLLDHPAIVVVGFGARTTNDAESDPPTARIPALWGAYMGRRGPADSPSYAVYTAYESDHTGAYDVTVGAEGEWATGGGLAHVNVPAGRYLVFANEGEIPGAVIEAWGAVWRHFAREGAPRRAYTTDFEKYDPARPGRVEIHIAVEQP
jgi:predicted transcriptional regulator YdeE